MNVHGQFNRDFNKVSPKYKRPDFKSQTAGELWDYFEDIRYTSEQNLILSGTTTFENAIIALASDTEVNTDDFIRILTALSYAFNNVKPTHHKKWSLFQTFGQHLPAFDHRIQEHLQGASSAQITNMAMALKRLKTKPSDHTMVIIENQFLRHMQGATIFNISNTLDSMACLAYVPSERFINSLVPRIDKRKKSKASKSENRQFTQTLQALATMQATSHSNAMSRPDIRESALQILNFLDMPKTATGINQLTQIDTQFEFGLNSEAIEQKGVKSKQEKHLRKIFNALINKMPNLSPRDTPNRILNVTHTDVDYALSYFDGEKDIPILIEYDGSDHFVFGTRPDGSFGEVSWNGSTILNSSNKTKLCPDAIVVHIPYFVLEEAIKLKTENFNAEAELVQHLIEQAIKEQAGQFEIKHDPDAQSNTVKDMKLFTLQPDLYDSLTAEAA